MFAMTLRSNTITRQRRRRRKKPSKNSAAVSLEKGDFSGNYDYVTVPNGDLRLDGFTSPVGSDNSCGFLDRLGPTLSLLRWTGYFPTFLSGRSCPSPSACVASWLASFTAICLSLTLFCFNIYVIHMTRLMIGMMHVETMTIILTGLKPLQALLNLTFFILGIRRHTQFLEALCTVDTAFHNSFSASTNCARGWWFMVVFSVLAGVVPFGGRLTQFILGGERIGQFWLSDISLLVVPTMAILQYLPLFYFVYVNSLLRFWFRRLEKLLRADQKCRDFSLSFYYRSVWQDRMHYCTSHRLEAII